MCPFCFARVRDREREIRERDKKNESDKVMKVIKMYERDESALTSRLSSSYTCPVCDVCVCMYMCMLYVCVCVCICVHV